MLRLKRLHYSLISILALTSVTHVASAVVLSKNVRQHCGWYVDLEAFDARANDALLSTLPFAQTRSFSSTPLTTIGDVTFRNEDRGNYFDPDYQWGYRAAVGYDFASCNCCNYGFSLEYTYHKADEDQHLDIPGTITDTSGTVINTFFSDSFTTANHVDASYNFKYHTLDFLGHSNMTLCNCVDLQVFVGARYLWLNEDYDRHFVNPLETEDDGIITVYHSELTNHYKSRFNGIGPRVGVNSFYQIFNGFGLTSEVAGNLVYGCSKSHYFENSFFDITSGEITQTNIRTVDFNGPRNNHIVPGLSGKIGLAYRSDLANCASLAVEIGYRADKYFGLTNHSTLVQVVDYDPAFEDDGIYHDYDLSGPYINFTYHM